jgi:hypothetical protein
VKDQYIETDNEMVRILNPLNRHIQVGTIIYYLTAEGQMFIDNGGYVTEKKIRTKRISRDEAYDARLANGTVALAGVTLLLVLVEILKWYFESSQTYNYFSIPFHLGLFSR